MFKKSGLFLLVGIFLVNISNAQQVDPAHRTDWFREAKFGMFVHFGLYSILGGSYNGHTLPDTSFPHGKSWYAEWIEQRLEVPHEVYRGLVKKFNPVKFNADEWIRLAKEAGMKYFVITAKHHDGFALWNSKVSDYDIASTPYKKDILGELAKACKKYGLKFGFYYSHCEDWNYPGGAKPHWKPRVGEAAFAKYWKEKVIPQIKELINRYHPDLFWFDTWGDEQEKVFITDKRRDQLIALIRKMEPKCLINGRISYLNPGDQVDYLSMLDNAYPGEKKNKPWQTPATMVHSWGWHAKDYHWKTSRQMISFLVSNVSKGGNYLLNVGPKPDGSFPKMAVRRLMEIGGWMAANSEAVYGTRHVNKNAPEGVVFTKIQNPDGTISLYVCLLKERSAKLALPFKYADVLNCELLQSGMPVQYQKTNDDKVMLILPKKVANLYDGVQVVKLVMSDDRAKERRSDRVKERVIKKLVEQ